LRSARLHGVQRGVQDVVADAIAKGAHGTLPFGPLRLRLFKSNVGN
jgi:hypothetical protein